jgi:hypothetical protein
MAQLCQQTQAADQRAREALEKFKQQYAPRPRNAQEAAEMAGAADHPVRWVRGKDGHLDAISPYAPDTYKVPRLPTAQGSSPTPLK